MKSKTVMLLSGITLLTFLSVPIRLAAQESRQQAERAAKPETGTTNPVPLINQPLVPDAVAPGGAGFTLIVNGTGFVSGSVVNWNGNAVATTFVSGSQLAATVPAADVATATTGWVTAANPTPGGTSNLTFFPVTIPSPTISMQRTDYATGSGAEGVATGDFNGDGKLDLAVSNDFSGTVSVLLGNGDGTFQAQVDYAVGSGPNTVVARDFNGDGKLDLAVSNNSSGSVSVLLGNGDGTFQPANSFAVGSGSGRMAAGDFNGDGKLDLATTNGTVSILLGNGDGTFQPHVDYQAGGAFPIAVGDVNQDGKLDLIVCDSGSSAFAVLLGNGDGTFQPYVSYSTIFSPNSLVLGDFNEDGKLDLAIFSITSGSPGLAILLGNGDGTFQSFAQYATGCGDDQTDCTAVTSDLNGDGHLDLAVRNSSASAISVFLGNGDGTFQNPVNFAGEESEQIAVGDFNGDGRLDLAVGDLNTSSVSVFLQVTGPLAVLSPASLSFGTQLIGTGSVSQTVTLSNPGIAALNITSITASPNFPKATTCGTTLAVGANCHFLVNFTPSTLGTVNGTLTITDNAPGSPHTVSLTGAGTEVILSPTSLNFGNQPVDTRSYQTLTFTNHGKAGLSISQVSITGTDPTDFGQTNTCGSRVAAGASCAFRVTFTPRATGSRAATLNLTDTGGGSPQTVALSGTGT